jgi:hypothetical protein
VGKQEESEELAEDDQPGRAQIGQSKPIFQVGGKFWCVNSLDKGLSHE